MNRDSSGRGRDGRRPVLALTMGDAAGIGPEITLRALGDVGNRRAYRPIVIADAGLMSRTIEGIGLDLEVVLVQRAGDDVAEDRVGVVPVLDLGDIGPVRPGELSAACGRAAVQSIETACKLAIDGAVDGIVTAPISKEAIRAGGSTFPGHTEMLADLFGVPGESVMTMFLLDRLKIFFLSRHASLARTIEQLSTDAVLHGLVRTHELMEELGFMHPTVALAALNPHAGENGLLGHEEIDILRPAVAAARGSGVDAVGPVPADAVFNQARHGRYDAVLSLYHDQGHVAAKTLDFFGTVSCTLGLPVIRTSVDHGTAFDIAGKGIADARGQVAAVRVACELAASVTSRAGTARER